MNFLAVLAALLAERQLGLWRDDRWPSWTEPLRWLLQPRRPVGAVLLVTLPAIAVGFGHALIGDALIRAALGGLILFLCLGPRDLGHDIEALLDARRRRDQFTADTLTDTLQDGPAPETGHDSLLGALFIQSHERMFAVLLWFLFAGPGGALLYRLASRAPGDLPRDTPVREAADTLHALLAWVPQRVCALLFALAGSMDDALERWNQLRREAVSDWRQHGWTLLADVAVAALDFDSPQGPALPSSLDDCLREVAQMQNRALLLLLAAAALFAGGALLT